MKNQLLFMIALLFTIVSTAQRLSHVTAKNDYIQLTFDDGKLTIKNVSQRTQTIVLSGTTEDTICLKKGECKNLSVKDDNVKVVGAKIVGGCNCWLQLVIDCSLLPIKVSNIQFTSLGDGIVKIDFDAYNSEKDGRNTFIVQYSKDKGRTWQNVQIDVPEVTGLSKHYSRTFKIN